MGFPDYPSRVRDDAYSRSRSGLLVPASDVAVQFAALGWDAFPWWASNAEQTGRVTRDYALSVDAVLAARNIVCGTIASLTMRVLDEQNNVIRSPLLEQIDPDVPNPVTMASLIEDVLFEGIGWLRVMARDQDGFPLKARRVDPNVVSAQAPPGYILANLPSGHVPGSTLWVGGEPVSTTNMKRFDSLHPPLLVTGARTIRRAHKLSAASEMYADQPAPRMWLTPKVVGGNVSEPDEDEIGNTIAQWEARRKAHAMGFVPNTFDLNESKGYTPVELQLATLIEKATISVANIFGLTANDLNVPINSDTYNNAVDRRYDKVNETYGPLVAAIASRLSMEDMTRPGHHVDFDWSKYLTPNPLDRATVAKTYIDAKVITPEEVRHDLGRVPFTDEQREELKPTPQPAPLPVNQDQDDQPSNVVPFRRATGFSGDMGLVFDGLDVAETFSVDERRRTITGLVMPWGEVGRSGGAKWRFSKDSLKFNKAHVNQIKLLVDHDPYQSVGRLERTWSDETGQWGTFKVARGSDGDRALAMAADGARDRFSVGIGYQGSDTGVIFTDSPDGVRDVTAAPWRETSLVALPAFASARSTAVTMTADPTGEVMPDTTPEPQAQTAAQGAAVTFSADQFAQLMANLRPATPEPTPTPATVNPTALPLPTVQVNEQPLYRFDGNPAQRCFIEDVKNQFGHDNQLRGKAEQFIADAMGKAFAAIATGDVDDLNPVIQRPDLYVPRLEFNRAMGAMTQGGAVASLTASKFPKFNAASGLVGTHTPGTEPTEGAVSTTSGDVTPVGLSGKLILQREIVDQGGTPQLDQVLWGLMTQEYAYALEQRLENLFNALVLTPKAIVGVNKALSADLISELTALQFIRGGDRYSAFAVHSAFYSALAGAVDDNGRHLFPMEAPSNANGATAGDLSSIRVHGKVARPAWALETANGGPVAPVSYLWVPGSVYQWFSPPRRIDLQYIAVATVELGIWGYSAEFVLRDTDVIEMTYAAV